MEIGRNPSVQPAIKHPNILFNQGRTHTHTLMPNSNLVSSHKLMGKPCKLHRLIPENNSDPFCYVEIYLCKLTQFAPPRTETERERDVVCCHGELSIHNHSECESPRRNPHLCPVSACYTHIRTHTPTYVFNIRNSSLFFMKTAM